MKTKKVIMLLVVLVFGKGLTKAQIQEIEPKNNNIQISLGINPGLVFERKISKNVSIVAEVDRMNQVYNVLSPMVDVLFEMPVSDFQHEVKGYKYRLETRFYLDDNSAGGVYIAPSMSYKFVTYEYDRSFTRVIVNTATEYETTEDRFTGKAGLEETTADLFLGVNRLFHNNLSINCYFGPTIRVKKYTMPNTIDWGAEHFGIGFNSGLGMGFAF